MPKYIRTLTKYSPRWRAYPWSRFSADELPREKPLQRCPDHKCRRAKDCLAAHFGLFCQRTHFARVEGEKRTPKTDMDKHIASIELPPKGAGLDLRLTYLKEITALRRSEQKDMIRIWRAGGYGKDYGPYRATGFMKEPPPRLYVEE